MVWNYWANYIGNKGLQLLVGSGMIVKEQDLKLGNLRLS
jgi:hypothetical protein